MSKQGPPAAKDNPQPPAPGRLKVVAYLALIGAVCVAIYFHSLNYGYTNHDDDLLITKNLEFIRDLSNLPRAFTTDAWYKVKQIELYRPLQSASYILDAWRGEDVGFAARSTNLALHILCCFCVFLLLLLLKFDHRLALSGSLVYAVHFLFVHTVIWIPARGDLLLSLFSFLTVITFILISRNPKQPLYYLLNILSFALALFSKETAILLPVVLALFFWFLSANRKFRPGLLVIPLAYLMIYVLFSWLRSISVTEDGKALGISALLLNVRTLPETLAKFFVPVNFSTMPSFRIDATVTGLLIIAGMIWLYVVRKQWFNRMTIFATGWFLLFLLPGMAYRPEFAFYTYEYLDHRAYLPFFGFLTIGLSMARQVEISGKMLMVIMIPLLVYLGSLNYYFSRCYQNPLKFSECALRTNPGSALARFIHGNQVFAKGDTLAALHDFSVALQVYPRFSDARFNRATIRFNLGQFDGARSDLDSLLQFNPEYGEKAYILRAETAVRLRDLKGAVGDYERVVTLNPGNGNAVARLDELKQLVVKLEEVPETVRQAGKLNDQGIREAREGRFREALAYFHQAVALYPGFSEAVINIGNCLDAMGDRAGACREWKKASSMGNNTGARLVRNHCN